MKINEDSQASLMAAFNHSDFERLAFSERTNKRMESVEADLLDCRKWAEEKLQAELNATKEYLERVRDSFSTRLEQEMDSFSNRQSALEALNRENTVNIGKTDNQLAVECAALRSRLDDECARVEKAAKTEAMAVLSAVRSDEGVRLLRLEGMFTESDQDRASAIQRIAQELQGLRVESAAKMEALEKNADAVENKCKQHFERVQDAMDCLNRELQEFVQLQEASDNDRDRLEQLVHALESRVYPWRGGHQRAQSPGRPFQQKITDEDTSEGVVRTGGGFKKGTAITDGVFDLMDKNKDGIVTRNEFRNAPVDWKNFSFVPKAPPSRPTSASKGRRREEKDVASTPAAGPAYAAARAKGAPMSAR